MAFRSSSTTTTRTSTASSTTTRTKSNSKAKVKPRLSTSSAMRKLVDSPSTDSDPSSSSSANDKPRRARAGSSDESDFGDDMREAADLEKRARVAKDEQARLRRAVKKHKDKGEELPAELKAALKKKKSAGSARAPVKDDVAAVIDNVAAERRRSAGKGRPRRGSSASDSSADIVPVSRPTRRRSDKRRAVQERDGIEVQGADSSDDGAAEDLVNTVKGGGELSDDPDEVKKHLARRWFDRKNPNVMSARRKQLELKYNPLVRMLNVEIQVGASSSRVANSDEERRQDLHIENLTDPDTDWSSPGMGDLNDSVVIRPRREPPPHARSRVETDSPPPHKGKGKSKEVKLEYDDMDEDVKPVVTPVKRSAQVSTVKRESPEDVKPVILLTDDEPEPDTADDDDEPADPTTSVHLDVKPAIGSFSSRPALDGSAAARARPGPVASTSALPFEVDDSGAEPDTESDGAGEVDDDVKTPSAALAPHFAAHTHALVGSSQTLGPASQRRADVKGESQSSLFSCSRAQSQRRSSHGVKLEVKDEPVDFGLPVDPDDSDVEFVDDAMLRGVAAAAREKAVRDEVRKKEDRRKAMQSEIAARRMKKEEAERDGQANYEDEDEDEDDERAMQVDGDDDDDEAPLMWDVGKGTKPVTWPQPVRKGRPKFMLESSQQKNMGAHLLSQDPSDKTQIPAPLNRFLRQYQREGAEFLYSQFKKGLGGILGDDMGLGKTIQVIAFLSAIMDKQGIKKYDDERRKKVVYGRADDDPIDKPSDLGPTCLIVCPMSVVHNWEREFKTWGYFDVGIFMGSKEKKNEMLHKFDRGVLDVVVAGFEAVRNQIGEFTSRDFTVVIVDEAHRVKNRKSATTQAMNQFPSRLRYGLTGTAMQNKLEEFWCVLNWAAPGRVGTHRQWDDLVSRPLKFAQTADATEDELALGRKRAMALVTSLLPNFWIRRTKDDRNVQLQLPPKTDNVVLCPLTALQQRVYRRLLQLEDVQIMLTADDPCPCGERDETGLPYRRGSCCEQEWTKLIFKYISLFQGVSNHLALMYPNREDKRKEPERYEQAVSWMQTAFPDDWQDRKPGPQAALDPDLCGKWKILCELLELWHHEGHKVLIFSMSLKILDLLSSLMETTHYKYLTLDGSTPQDERMPLVDEFNDPAGGIFCFLISTRAGGVGLNLTAANRVVIFDPNWNPSHDLQAMDRAYRFGQTRRVDVFRLIGAGTLEELIYNRQQYKRSMAKTSYDASSERRLYTGVQGEGKTQHGDLWGVKNIFSLSENFSLTEKSIERANLAELEYALRNSSIFETDDGKVADLDEPDAEEVVAEVTGYSKKADPTNQMSPEELARHERSLREQAMISRILSGVRTAESDDVIGGSNIELLRGHAAIQGQAARAKAVTAGPPRPRLSAPPPSSSSHKAKPVKKRSKTEHDDVPAWDPLSRSSGRPSATQRDASQARPALKKPKLESQPGPDSKGDAFVAAGLPEGVSVVDAIATAGYGGADGVQRFYREFGACDKGKKASMLKSVVRAWRKENPDVEDEDEDAE
ncbi:uncharacterized protein RHOBADRAFT_56261 [Rhodotorula graminis WP1]|uniref:Uncharacterized protein n=1 Tax=Rhodotorula graminis (strain WP1) TaxID=578459 RepID=A0A0P9IR28_RHOGW|nr:uncharacterized protein RHOBADRAFT_56261 [Rhodotorula graminis WP1]KPV71875.1 hypothetical protein RHOBADRAFT_56261 [Rhodotorula graminis WP1]